MTTFLRRNCVAKLDSENSEEVTFKIRFTSTDPNTGGEIEGICYVKYNHYTSTFELCGIEESNGIANELKINIIRPGRYDYSANAQQKILIKIIT